MKDYRGTADNDLRFDDLQQMAEKYREIESRPFPFGCNQGEGIFRDAYERKAAELFADLVGAIKAHLQDQKILQAEHDVVSPRNEGLISQDEALLKKVEDFEKKFLR